MADEALPGAELKPTAKFRDQWGRPNFLGRDCPDIRMTLATICVISKVDVRYVLQERHLLL